MRRQFFVRQRAGLVEPDNPFTVDEDQCRCRTNTKVEEILLAHRHAHPRRDGKPLLVGPSQILEFLFRRGVLTAGYVAI